MYPFLSRSCRGGLAALPAGLLLWSLLISLQLAVPAAAQAGAGAGRPNVLLITIDTLRADHLGCYGDRQAATPVLDALAHEGVRFDRAFTAVPLTLPSHTAMMTGTYPFANGVRDQPGFRLGPGIPTLAEIFSNAGYATGAVIASPVLDRRFGLARGFGFYDDRIAGAALQQTGDLPELKRPAGEVVARALAWLGTDAVREHPFFLWLHFYDPHQPYHAPEPYRSRFASHPYDGEIAYLDASLGRLFAGLRSVGRFNRTIIAVMADHGEGLGDHGESTHGYFIYNSTVRVPLIVKAVATPNLHPASGFVAPVNVSLVDVAPTLLRAAGLPVPSDMQGADRILSLEGEPDSHRPVYIESYYPLLHLGFNPLRALVAGKYKFIQAPKPELYDLAADPGEIGNLEASHHARAAAMRDDLDQLVRRNTPASVAATRSPVTEQQREVFASLGYLGGVSTEAPEFTTARRDPKDGRKEFEELLQAAHAVQARRFGAAEPILRAVLARDPDQPLALDYLGSIQFERRDYAAAQSTFAKLVKAAPFYATGEVELAHAEAMLGQRAAAEKDYKKAAAADPSDARALHQLGELLLAENRDAEAESAFRAALRRTPDDVFALNGLSQLLVQSGRRAEAVSLLEKAVNDDPQLMPPRLNLGFLYLQAQRFPKVIQLMNSTLALDPHQPQAFAERGAARAELGRRSEALADFRRAVALDPHNELARQGLQAVSEAPAARSRTAPPEANHEP
jgi:arylsulfatase A-like enzyme/Tfp pilus assembly protein PilF